MRKCYFILAMAAVAACRIDPANTDIDKPAQVTDPYVIPQYVALTDAEKAVAGGIQAFGIELFKQAVSLSRAKGENVLISPFSASVGLSMLLDGATGRTSDEIAGILGIKAAGADALHSYNDKVSTRLSGLTSERSPKINQANALWSELEVNGNYISTLERNYGAHVESITFWDNSFSAWKTINEWTAVQTGEKIKPDFSTELFSCVLENILQFNGLWNTDSYEKSEGNFRDVNDNSTTTSFFGRDGQFYYYNTESMSSIILPYLDDSYQMAVFLPKRSKQIYDMVEAMNGESFGKWISEATLSNVDFRMPSFQASSTSIVSSALKKMGMERIFLSTMADYSKMFSNTSEKLYVSVILQHTSVTVGSEGMEGATVLGETRAGEVKAEHFTFNADHPFVYAVMDRCSGAVLFLGLHVR